MRLKTLTLGYFRDVNLIAGLKTGLGADLTAYRYPEGLDFVYGSRPLATHLFLRLRWGNPHALEHRLKPEI